MGVTTWPAAGAAALRGETYHARRDGPKNAFRYGVDYLLIRMAPDGPRLPAPLGEGRFGLAAYSDRDHGDGDGPAVDWAMRTAHAQGLPDTAMSEVWLLTQPRRFGYVFNPVSFWFFRDAEGQARAVLAEVNNTAGDRHSYFCAEPGFPAITGETPIVRPKRFHVSPFQEIDGDYAFRFRLLADRISICIEHRRGHGGMVATLAGRLTPLDRKAAYAFVLRRPLGALAVFARIHWQAIKLACKGAPFRRRPLPPTEEITG